MGTGRRGGQGTASRRSRLRPILRFKQKERPRDLSTEQTALFFSFPLQHTDTTSHHGGRPHPRRNRTVRVCGKWRGAGSVLQTVCAHRLTFATGRLPPPSTHAPSPPSHIHTTPGSCSSSKPASTRSRSTPATRETRRCDWWMGGGAVFFALWWPHRVERAPRVAAHTRDETLDERRWTRGEKKRIDTHPSHPTPSPLSHRRSRAGVAPCWSWPTFARAAKPTRRSSW